LFGSLLESLQKFIVHTRRIKLLAIVSNPGSKKRAESSLSEVIGSLGAATKSSSSVIQ
jgi:hypothetical protein